MITQAKANLFAYPALPLPSMLPTSPDAANCTPSGNIKIKLLMFIIATIAANSLTPSMPLKITTNSKAHHSIHIKNVVGTASFK